MAPKKSGEPKKRPAKEKLTLRQSRFVTAYMKTRSKKQAAIIAGYPRKNASQSAQQVLKAIKKKAPEVMEELGLDMHTVIKNHLVPLLHATETQFAQHDGKFTDYVETEALGIRLGATRTALELLNAFPPRDPALAAQVGVEVIVMDLPRPQRPQEPAIDVQPTKKEEKPAKIEKPDPRPID